MAAPALPPLAVIQALVKSTMPVVLPTGPGVTNFFDREHRVNAFWNHVLFRLYNPGTIATTPAAGGVAAVMAPSPSTSIVISAEIYPKATDTSGDRADLAVSEVVLTTGGTAASPTFAFTQTFKLVYEGKGATSGDTPDNIKGQVQRFLLASDIGHTTACWVIAAKGITVTFYAWNGASTMQQVKTNSNAIGRFVSIKPTTSAGKTYDLTKADEYDFVGQILLLMLAAKPDFTS